jgi:hypothetical protein
VLGVYRTSDGGSSWQLCTGGLPEHAWVALLREGMASDRLDPAGIYLGTQSGSVFVSPDEGESWIEAPRICLPCSRSKSPRSEGRSDVAQTCRPVVSDGCRAEPGILRAAPQAMPTVLLPSLLATQGGGQNRFEVEAATVTAALRERRSPTCSSMSAARSGRSSTSLSRAGT